MHAFYQAEIVKRIISPFDNLLIYEHQPTAYWLA